MQPVRPKGKSIVEAALAQGLANTAALRAKNRTRMPATAAIMDEFRELFGEGVRLKWAREGEHEIGRQNAAD